MRRRGFTFIEIMIVIVILAILAAFVFPKVGGMLRHSQLQGASRDLMTTLRYGRHAAVLRQDGCELRIDPQSGQYQLVAVHLGPDGLPTEDDEDDDSEKPQLDSEIASIHVLPQNVFFTMIYSSAPVTEDNSLPRVIFYPDGSASSAKIGIQNDENSAYAVEIFRTTGLAQIKAGVPVLPPNVIPLYASAEHVSYENYR